MSRKRTPERRDLTIADLAKLDDLSVREIARLYPVSAGFVYGAIREGRLAARRFGRRVIVRRQDFEDLGQGETVDEVITGP